MHALLILAGVLLLIAFVAYKALRRFTKRHGGWPLLVARFWAGQLLSGRVRRTGTRTDAQHARRRWAILGTLVALLIGYVELGGVLTLAGVLGVLLAYLVWRTRTRYRRIQRAKAVSLHAAIGTDAGYPEYLDRPWDYIAIAPDNSSATIQLNPKAVRETNLKRITANTPLALGAGEYEVTDQQLHGPSPYLTFTKILPPAPIPGKLPLAEAFPHMDSLGGHKDLFKGLAAGGKRVKVSLKADAPHTILSWETGGGKSNAITADAMQLAHKGWVIIILDATGISYPWAVRPSLLPNVYCAENAEQVRSGLFWLADEIKRRNRVVREQMTETGYVEGGFGPDLFVVCDEKNLTQQYLTAAWKLAGNEGKDPALACIDTVLYAGRKINVHVILGCVRASAQAMGGGDPRSQAGILEFGANPRKSEWNMFFPGEELPESADENPPKGRVQLCAGGQVTEVQTPWVLEVPDADSTAADRDRAVQLARDVRAYAVSGTVTPVPEDLLSWGQHQDQDVLPATRVAGPGPGADVVTLREAVADKLTALQYEGFRSASKEPGFPEPLPDRGPRNAKLYSREDIVAWEASRADQTAPASAPAPSNVVPLFGRRDDAEGDSA